ncbi:MAG: hypothetical protein LBG52_03370 [Candidatus Peribacteria bacterium]|jgi:hypothetical protein|nr:hypothetical protein [Candidatus Peribacteria bacterium]
MFKQEISLKYLTSLIHMSKSLEYFTPKEVVEIWQHTEWLPPERIDLYQTELVMVVEAARKREHRFLSADEILTLMERQ